MAKHNSYLDILIEELIPAQGCTEPIAIAYAAAKAREVLGCLPDRILVKCSGNLIKNAKSVVVPNTGGLKGIEAGALAGIIGGNPSKGMQVLADIGGNDILKISGLMGTGYCRVEMIRSLANLHIVVQVFKNAESASVEIVHCHTNISRIEKNGDVLYSTKNEEDDFNAPLKDRSFMSIEGIYDFTISTDINEVKDLLDKQVEYNLAIAEEGLTGKYGVNIGAMLLDSYGDGIFTKVRAYAAAGSDARMSGCNLPVIINSGSGNQGMTASLPVIIYAREKGLSDEMMYRALLLSNLIAIYHKAGLGRLSAYCGAVCAACGSGAGITFLKGGTIDQINATITNTLANVAGIICDGAKASCAAKIATCLDAAIMAHLLALRGMTFDSESGIVKGTVESTIAAACRLGREGMRETDAEILKIMMDE